MVVCEIFSTWGPVYMKVSMTYYIMNLVKGSLLFDYVVCDTSNTDVVCLNQSWRLGMTKSIEGDPDGLDSTYIEEECT